MNDSFEIHVENLRANFGKSSGNFPHKPDAVSPRPLLREETFLPLRRLKMGRISGLRRGFGVFAHAAFNQKPDQQHHDARHDGENRPFETLAASAFKLNLKTSRDLKRIRAHNCGA